jgi:HprK-related kinase A
VTRNDGEITIGDIAEGEFVRRLREPGLGVRIGPFDARLCSDVRAIEAPLYMLYRDYPLLDDNRVFSFHARLTNARRFPHLYRRLVRFMVDGRAPHEDLPHAQALAVLEWGLNLVVALRTHSLLMLHSAVVERFGAAMLLPALPGYGKTTLCVGMVHRGWRLFSDEFGLVGSDGNVIPFPRPMSLKNKSIEIIRAFAHDAELGPSIPNTRKGTVAHVRPPRDSVRAASQTARAKWIVFPRWQAGAKLTLEEVPKAEAFMELATNAFNFEMLGERAFTTVRDVVDGAQSFRLLYSDLEEAIERLRRLAAGAAHES